MSENEFIQSFDQYSDAIFRFCYLKTSSREEAQDLTQETFAKVWQSIRLDTEIQNIRAFLYTTARNLITDYYRKKKAGSLDEMRDAGFDVASSDHEAVVFDAEAKVAIEEINKLDPKYSEIVYLRLVEGLGPKEIAEIVGENENVVSVRLNRGIKEVRDKLKY